MSAGDEGDNPQAEETEPSAEEREARRLEKQRRVLDDVVRGAMGTVEQKVAWILNNYPAARDSDITLQLEYWEAFVPGYDSGSLAPDDLYTLPRLTTLSRARATIQNRLKLFQATPEVRVKRGTLSVEERERAVRSTADPVFFVFADESGKTQDHLVVGSLWVLHSPEFLRLIRALIAWRAERRFADELHFANIGDGNIDRYLEAVDIVMVNAAAIGFKSASVPRRGAGQVRDAIGDLFYQVIALGVEHENATGRAPLPRALQLRKDAEDDAYDKLLLADISDRLVARFQDQLPIDLMEAVPSRGADLIQIADLFTGSVNRVTNRPSSPPGAPNAKDRFADHLLGAIGWTATPGEGDMAICVAI